MVTREQCPFIDDCPMVRYFNRMARIAYQDMFCHRNFTGCVRYKLKAAELASRRKRLPPYSPPKDDMPPPSDRWQH